MHIIEHAKRLGVSVGALRKVKLLFKAGFQIDTSQEIIYKNINYI